MGETKDSLSAARERMRALYGENKKITDDNYDKSLAVRCINGTFVGRRTDGVIAYKGIPFVGRQPVGELRWKAPVDVVPNDGVYEAYYFGKCPRQIESFAQMGSLYVQGEDCLYLNVWKRVQISSKRIRMSSLFPSSTGSAFSASFICPTCRMEGTIRTRRIWE